MCFLALAVLTAAIPTAVCGGVLASTELSCTETQLAASLPVYSDLPCPCQNCGDDSHCTDCVRNDTHSHQVPVNGSPDDSRTLRSLSAVICMPSPLRQTHMRLSRDAANQSDPGTSILQQWCTVRLLV